MENENLIEFTYRPKTEAKRILPTVLTLAGASAVLVVLSVTAPAFRGLISLAAVIGITVSMYLFLRYAANDFVYSVTHGGEGEMLFVVARVIGKRTSVMCSFRIAEIINVEAFTKAEKSQHAPARDAQKFNFCPNFSPEVVYLIKTASPSGKLEVMIECTDEVAARLRDYAAAARAAESDEDVE